MNMQYYVDKVRKTETLDIDESKEVMNIMLSGEATEEELYEFLLHMSERFETIDEVIGMVTVMREKSLKVNVKGPLLDTCGTGGSGLKRFNVSTISSFVLASLGVKTAKHGNRAQSGRVGSFDLLEKLGANIELYPEQVEKTINSTGIGFMFAPIYHPAMKYVATARRRVARKTIFNVLGPLSNPAFAEHHVMGAFSGSLAKKMAKVLSVLGSKRSLVVHGHDGLDEMTISDINTVYEVIGENISKHTINPEYMGIPCAKFYEIEGGDMEDNVMITKAILKGIDNSRRTDMVALNISAGLYVSGKVPDFRIGLEMAREAISEGLGYKKLEEYIDVSRSV